MSNSDERKQICFRSLITSVESNIILHESPSENAFNMKIGATVIATIHNKPFVNLVVHHLFVLNV